MLTKIKPHTRKGQSRTFNYIEIIKKFIKSIIKKIKSFLKTNKKTKILSQQTQETISEALKYTQ